MRRRDSSDDGAKGPESGGGGGESQIREDEVFRMAAFRIHETSNRIATLANRVRDEALRRDLLQVCERLLNEERELLQRARR